MPTRRSEMKTRYLLYIFVIIFLLAGFISTGFTQSSQCTVIDKQGGLVTVSCPGEGTKVFNMGGAADIYKAGDAMDMNKQADKVRDTRPKVR
jgi:hypothetical protein